MPTDFQQAIEADARRQAMALNAAIERACERSLQEGRNGVMVERRKFDAAAPYLITPSHPDVPYGAIFHRDI